MLQILLIIMTVVVLAILIYLATLEGSYSIRRSQLINADINVVFDKIRDFKSWPDWSPWLIHEPETKLNYSDNYNEEGGFYTWEGKRVGAGKLTHIKFNRPNRIEQKLQFTRPFKSVCDVGFEFSANGGKTEVTWFMQGRMPFLFRFMTAKTKDMISKDYELGLAMLNGQCDPKSDHPVLQFEGETNLEPWVSLCQGFAGDIKSLEEAMKQGFPKLMTHIEQHKLEISGAPFAAYHEVDLKNMQFVCDMAIPVVKTEGLVQGEYQLKTLGGGRFYKVTVKGSYDFLELAWYSAMAHVQMHKFKYDNSRASMEVYENDPEQVKTSNDILTTLYIPLK